MRIASSFVLFAGALAFAGCSGGSTDSLSSLRVRCNDGAQFCIVSCDLGCSSTGCSVTDIAENQRLQFKFSDRVDASSVNGASISIRTATGVAPNGEFLVNDNTVTFVPSVTTVGGVSSFGFVRNESYIIALTAGQQGVRNLSGDRLGSDFACTVVASRGIQDENGEPPTVELLSPTDLNSAPSQPTVVLRFSELIDTTPLQAALSDASPIRVVLRGQLANGTCDTDAEGIALSGVPVLSTEMIGSREVTVVTWQPNVTLPGNSCITVRVTADLRDLSGRSAIPAKFQFLTQAGVSVPITLTESFTNSAGQLPLVSGGVWGGAQGPGARPGQIGGDGRHGSFDPQLGTPVGGGVFEWNTDSFTIPASVSLTGQEYLVTDGRFYFTDFVLPSGTTLRFSGSVPPVINVRGQAIIDGNIEVNGEDVPSVLATVGPAANQRISTFHARGTPTSVFVLGQEGTAGGVGGGRGGDGGKEGNNIAPEIVNGVSLNDGQPGENIRVLASHAYAGLAGGTGGGGGKQVPATGVAPTLPSTQLIASIYQPFYSSGGAGGGFIVPGTNPVPCDPTATQPIITEPVATGGVAFPLLPYPTTPPANYTSLDHYTVGGSGGGGGGSHGFGLFGFTASTERWMAGSAGTGGGGAVALRAGGDVQIGANASLQAKGGNGCFITGDDVGTPTTADINAGISSPGGGGSGGSFLVQSGQDLSVLGAIDTSGGNGSVVALVSLLQMQIQTPGNGGNGSDGFYRLEAAGSLSMGGTGVPAYDAATQGGTLLDGDDRSGDTSTWRSSLLVFPPTWLRYELDVDFNGDGTIDETFTDSAAPGTQRAWELGGPITLPVQIEFQGADLDANGNVVEGSLGPWRAGIGGNAGPGINLDSVTAVRFTMTYNRGMFPNMVVRALRIFAQS